MNSFRVALLPGHMLRHPDAQDADAVLFVYRESYYLERAEPREGTDEHIAWMRNVDEVRNQAEVIIGKQRHGPIGKVKLFFDSRYTRFGNLSART